MVTATPWTIARGQKKAVRASTKKARRRGGATMRGMWLRSRRPFARVVCVSWLSVFPRALAAQEDQPIEERIRLAGVRVEEARQFFGELQANVARDNRPAVCKMLKYPFTRAVFTSGGADVPPIRVAVRAERVCRQNYPGIFPPQIRDIIANATFEFLFADEQGVMIGGDTASTVWFGRVCRDSGCRAYDIKVIAMNQAP
jgi:hypothetical protein